MTQYLLSIYQPDGPTPEPDALAKIMSELEAVNEDIRAAGAWVFAAGLHAPETSTVVKVAAGDVLVTDGPYIEGKEHLGGFTVIEVADLDAALHWARRVAAVLEPLAIEVRPFQG